MSIDPPNDTDIVAVCDHLLSCTHIYKIDKDAFAIGDGQDGAGVKNSFEWIMCCDSCSCGLLDKGQIRLVQFEEWSKIKGTGMEVSDLN